MLVGESRWRWLGVYFYITRGQRTVGLSADPRGRSRSATRVHRSVEGGQTRMVLGPIDWVRFLRSIMKSPLILLVFTNWHHHFMHVAPDVALCVHEQLAIEIVILRR